MGNPQAWSLSLSQESPLLCGAEAKEVLTTRVAILFSKQWQILRSVGVLAEDGANRAGGKEKRQAPENAVACRCYVITIQELGQQRTTNCFFHSILVYTEHYY